MMTLLSTAQSAVLAVLPVLLIGLVTLGPTPAHAGGATYKHDNLGRLTEVIYSAGTKIKYSYDAAGNRTAELVTGTGTLSPETKAALIAILTQLLLDDD